MIHIAPFLAELPRLNPKMLPDPHAVLARNCDLESMSLKPSRGTVLTETLGTDTQSIYRHPNGTWFQWDELGIDARSTTTAGSHGHTASFGNGGGDELRTGPGTSNLGDARGCTRCVERLSLL